MQRVGALVIQYGLHGYADKFTCTPLAMLSLLKAIYYS